MRSMAHHLWNVWSENCLFQPQGTLGFHSVIIVMSQDLEAAWEGEDRRVGPTYDFKRGHHLRGETHIWLLPKPPETCWAALPLSSGVLTLERIWGAMLIARVSREPPKVKGHTAPLPCPTCFCSSLPCAPGLGSMSPDSSKACWPSGCLLGTLEAGVNGGSDESGNVVQVD